MTYNRVKDQVLKALRAAGLGAALSAALLPAAHAAAPEDFGRSLVTYFSRYDNSTPPGEVDVLTMASILVSDGRTLGTTAFVAEKIAGYTGGDIYAIKTQELLPAGDQTLIDQNHREQNASASIALQGLPDISGYDTIFIGFPIWAMHAPRAVVSFARELNASGKRVVLFCSHDGYGAGRARSELAAVMPDAKVQEGILSVDSGRAADCGAEVESFLKGLRLQ